MGYYRMNPARGIEEFVKQFQGIADSIEKGITVETGNFSPRLDVTENDANFIVHIELPGVAKSDVKVSVNDEYLMTIEGEKKRSDESNLLRSERVFGAFKRNLQLPETADVEKIKATYNQGVLELTIDKKIPETPKQYEVIIN
ncbi:MAG: heat-shock protein Hsp20 [Ignavibacteriae bacterium HGW-Ignavibacteriae-1]|nr:MAG: heat-shock protein Hsp20 [Ignavibacteriae bacterium HGW-Ignavibacteriae-1]